MNKTVLEETNLVGTSGFCAAAIVAPS